MNTKIMEGIVGANTAMKLTDTSMKVYYAARHEGDTEKMERAMNYTEKNVERAGEYKAKAEEGIKEEAEETREKTRLEQMEAVKNNHDLHKSSENNTINQNTKKTDTLELSKEGLSMADKVSADVGEIGNEIQVAVANENSNQEIAQNLTGAEVKSPNYLKSGEIPSAKTGGKISVRV